MYSKLDSQIEQYLGGDTLEKRQVKINAWRARIAMKEQRRNIQKKLFGQHYNFSKVGLNKEKKYLIQEQRNTEIERSNRILLQKIQRISKRSVPIATRKRIFTQQDEKSYPSDTESNMMTARQYQTTNHNNKSVGQLEKIANNDFKSTRGELKFLFKGSKSFQGKLILIKTYIANGKFTIAADIGRIKQKIYLEMDQYRIFFRDVLGADHTKILQYLNYNGQVLELSGIRKQTLTVQQKEEIQLPHINPKKHLTLQLQIEQKQTTQKEQKYIQI